MPSKVVRDVAEWLHTQGYPLEYETARILRSAGFRVEQGRHWMDVDPITEEQVPRELDVLATSAADGWPQTRSSAVQLVVECKHGIGPWIILGGSPTPPIADLLLGASELAKWVGTRRALPGLLGSMRPIAFGVAEKKAKGAPEAAYEAVMEATRAAYRMWLTDYADWVVPVVVVDGPLLALTYADDGQESLREVRRGRIAWSGAALRGWQGATRREPVLVEIVHRSALSEFARQAWQTATTVRAALKSSKSL
ncbi:MAG: hypothetical protein M3406_11740 [Chloroflexota bacterium]|nr:hypothetical protein [Chloroflexota bacterium]